MHNTPFDNQLSAGWVSHTQSTNGTGLIDLSFRLTIRMPVHVFVMNRAARLVPVVSDARVQVCERASV